MDSWKDISQPRNMDEHGNHKCALFETEVNSHECDDEKNYEDEGQNYKEQVEMNENNEKGSEEQNLCDELAIYCSQCDFNTNNKRKLRDHMRYHHKDPTSCHLCPMSFSSKWKADHHLRNVQYTFRATHLCQECGKQFTCLSNMIRHQKNVHREKVTKIQERKSH